LPFGLLPAELLDVPLLAVEVPLLAVCPVPDCVPPRVVVEPDDAVPLVVPVPPVVALVPVAPQVPVGVEPW
jgi:hypothetical protein